ncbi:MAG: ribonuclease P protein component [Prevotellaceae bacterium]|jgi:ribonuclease P protein component|nr:ribonuclease P protein component [Prevotellaceae bacterium]
MTINVSANPKPASLPKNERLCSRKQIAALMEHRTVLFRFPFKVFFSFVPPAAGTPCCQMALNVPKRNFKKAVTRNLLKRRIREAFRKNKTELYSTLSGRNQALAVFFHYVSPEILPYANIESNLCHALAALADKAVERTGAPADTGG